MKSIQRIIVILGVVVLVTSILVWGQTPPTPDITRPIYTYFPESLVCNEVVGGSGLSIGLVTIGETTLQEIDEIYSEYFEVRIEYFEEVGRTIISLYRLDNSTIYQGVDVCTIDDVIVVADRKFPTDVELEELYDSTSTAEPPSPASFQRVNMDIFVRRYGIPDVVAFSTNPNLRVAFWFEYGIAAEFYIVLDPPDTEYPPAFGALSRVIYFPFQDTEGYEERWPFNQTFPEELYITYVAPYVATDVPTKRNPFDFDSMVATMTAEPSRTPTPTLMPVTTATP